MNLKIINEKLKEKVKDLEKKLTRIKRSENDLVLFREIIKNMAEGVCLVSTSDASIVYANK